MTDQSQPEERRWRASAVVLVAVLAIVLVITGGVALITGGLPRPGPSGPNPPPTQPHLAGPDGFPSEASGMPVISVGDALTLASSGGVDGRAMAVGGWWLPDWLPSCPWPGRDTLPIEGYCTTDYLSSAPYERVTCHDNGDGSGGCQGNPVPPGVQMMPAIALQETGGADALGNGGARPDRGIPVVLIVHVGDLRSRQCPLGSQDECSKRAIVDRVAWVAGEDVESGAAIDLATALTPDEAIFASRFEGYFLAALPVRLGEAWKVDPRLHGTGDDPVWVVRGIPLESVAWWDHPSRAVEVRLVDDATSRVLFTGSLGPGADYAPARLLVQATEPMDAAGSNSAIFYRVEGTDGDGLVEAQLGGTMPSAFDTTVHTAAAPTLLDAGSYLVRVWRAAVPGNGHAHFNECTQRVSLVARGEVVIEAAFAGEGDCTFVTPTFENPFDL